MKKNALEGGITYADFHPEINGVKIPQLWSLKADCIKVIDYLIFDKAYQTYVILVNMSCNPFDIHNFN